MQFRKNLKQVNTYTPGKPIEELKRSLGLKQAYKLASNEIPFAPRYLKGAIIKELENINRYPESGCFYLRQQIARRLKVKENELIFGNGSDELITMVLRATVEPGDEVIVAYPTFLIYEIQAKIQGAKVIRVGLKNFRYDLAAMAEKCTQKTKIIFIANPDNPTGTYLNHQEVYEFIKKIPKNILIYLDEAYCDFAPQDFPKSLNFLRKYPNIIIARTFSKVFGLAGLRIGYCVTTKTIAAMLEKVRDPFNTNRFAQTAALAALKNEDFLKKVVSHVLKEKKFLYKGFNKLGISYIESATNFILVDFRKDTLPFYNYLLKNGVIIRLMSGWGLKNFFRVTVGLHKENKKFINCLKTYLHNTEVKQ